MLKFIYISLRLLVTKTNCQLKNIKHFYVAKKKHTAFICIIFLLINFHDACYAQKDNIKNTKPNLTNSFDIKKFTPKEHEIIFNKTADINANGFADVLLISENPNNPKEPRLFQILQNNKDINFVVHKNYNIIPSICHGGMTKEPTFRSVKTIKNGFIIVTSAVDFNNFYTFKYTFLYSKKYKDWIVSKLIIENINSTKNNLLVKKVFSYPYNFKLVKFEQANVYDTTCICSGCGDF